VVGRVGGRVVEERLGDLGGGSLVGGSVEGGEDRGADFGEGVVGASRDVNPASPPCPRRGARIRDESPTSDGTSGVRRWFLAGRADRTRRGRHETVPARCVCVGVCSFESDNQHCGGSAGSGVVGVWRPVM